MKQQVTQDHYNELVKTLREEIFAIYHQANRYGNTGKMAGGKIERAIADRLTKVFRKHLDSVE